MRSAQFQPYNHFTVLNNPDFSDQELALLIKNYPAVTELDKQIRKLLIATRSFRDATALNTPMFRFKDMRDQSNTDSDLLEKMNKAGETIQTIQTARDAQKDNKDNFSTFENGLSYALGSIAERLRTLEKIDANDNVIRLYKANNGNKLKMVLPPVMLAKERFRAV